LINPARSAAPDIESSLQYDAGDKGIYRHYMQKEIYEQPNAIKNTSPGALATARLI
jgi:glucosamine--fructose-6-phosphate aminotransferase (isomerizing)